MNAHHWLVTGASSGFGRALTGELRRRGDAVTTLDRHSGVDVTDPAQVRAAIARVSGPITRVVSCAGFGALGAAEEQGDDLIARQIAVNLTGSITVIRAAIPRLRAAGGGRIFQFSSSGGQVADPGMSVYNATKFGIEGFVSSIAIELAPFGIEVTLVAPGGSGTGFLASMAQAAPLPAYRDGVLGQVRGLLGGDPAALRGLFRVDPAKVAVAIVEAAAQSPAPRRLVLGRVAYQAIDRELRQRLDELGAQRDIAYAADLSDLGVS